MPLGNSSFEVDVFMDLLTYRAYLVKYERAIFALVRGHYDIYKSLESYFSFFMYYLKVFSSIIVLVHFTSRNTIFEM